MLSTLRRTRIHLQRNCCRRYSGGGPLGVSDTRNRLVNSHNTIVPVSGAAASSLLPRCSLKSPVTDLSTQKAYVSSEGKSNPTKSNLLINADEELPDIYSSPSALLLSGEGTTQLGSISSTIVPLTTGFKSIVISKNGEDENWYSAAYIDTQTQECFYSGKFGGEIWNKIGKNHNGNTPLYSREETCTIDGRVYYRSESVANEAACARVLDFLAFSYWKDSKMGEGSIGDTLEPLRYCVEPPDIDHGMRRTSSFEVMNTQSHPSADGNNKLAPIPVLREEEVTVSSIAESKPHLLHVPKDLLFRFYPECGGAVNASYNIQKLRHDNGDVFHATFKDPITNEVFRSGLGRAIDVGKFPGLSLKTPLDRAEVILLGGKVYYRDPKLAEHAAASRVIDCYIFREEGAIGNGTQLCLEDPYKTMEEGTSQDIDYDALLAGRSSLSADEPRGSALDPVHHKKKSTFSSIAESNPHFLHVPKQFLTHAFGRCYGLPSQIFTDLFDVQKLRHDNRDIFHATFKDPITNEVFLPGLGREINVQEHPPGGKLGTPLHRAEISVLGGKVYYRDPKLAEHAAASRLIDCYIFREEGVIGNGTQLCLEDPYKTMEEGASQEIDYDALLAGRSYLSADEPNESALIPVVNKKKSTFSSTAEAKPHLLHVPKEFLGHAFRHCHGFDQRKINDSFHVQELTYGNNKIYNATFKDPITNEEFSSGLGRAIDVEQRFDIRTPLHRAEVNILDGKVYYHDPKLAEHAAASRAIDCFIFREEKKSPDVQLCLEAPYHNATERDAQQIDYELLLNMRTAHENMKDQDQLFQRDAEQVDCDELSIMKDNLECKKDQVQVFQGDASQVDIEEPISTRNNHESEKDQFDNLPGLTFSFNGDFTKVNNKLSTLGRIAELWTDEAGLGSSSSATSMLASAESTTKYKIENLLHWYEKANQKPQNHGEASALAHLCNKILTALGKTNTELHLNENDCNTNVEKDAKIILDKIMSLSRSFDDKSFIDADTFNAYMHCLSRLDPSRSAKSAKDLLNIMAKNEPFGGMNLPNPNVGTYNAVMGLCALADDQNDVNEVYSSLEAASLVGVDKRSGRLRPNNETFKTLLAVNSQIDGSFSFDRAIAKMQQISGSVCGETFIPDAALYSAALGPPIKKSKADSTANRYTKSWEHDWLGYGYQYDGGFKCADESSNTEAIDMEKWLLNAEECGVDPNVEMYEAVIQSWTATGRKDGLLKAEQWATRAVSSSSPTRLKTFHPIIASWALCRSERAPGRVEEWKRQLEAVSASKPNLKPDLSFSLAQIIAETSVQAGTISNLKDDNDNVIAVEALFAGAQNCKQLLENTFLGSKLESLQDTAALVSMFTHTIQAWACASRFSNSKTSTSDGSRGVREIIDVANLFQSKVDGDESEEHAQHILHLMGAVYAEIASQLYQIDSSDETNSCFCQNIAHIEKMIRDYELHSRRHFSQSISFRPESKATRHHLYKEILRGCANVSTDDGSVVRVCNLIMDHLSHQNEQCHDTGGGRVQEDITHLYVDIVLLMGTIVRSPNEKMQVLTTVHDNASRFFTYGRRFQASSYATVDRARLLGSIRMAMGGSELTEDFIRNFDEQKPKRRVQGKTAMTFVHEMLKKRK